MLALHACLLGVALALGLGDQHADVFMPPTTPAEVHAVACIPHALGLLHCPTTGGFQGWQDSMCLVLAGIVDWAKQLLDACDRELTSQALRVADAEERLQQEEPGAKLPVG